MCVHKHKLREQKLFRDTDTQEVSGYKGEWKKKYGKGQTRLGLDEDQKIGGKRIYRNFLIPESFIQNHLLFEC